MEYTIHYQNPLQQFIYIDLRITDIQSDEITLKLPVWRPGRYELAEYIQNIQKFEIIDNSGYPLHFEKSGKSEWIVNTHGHETITIKYNYYAHKMDAGSSWIDQDQLYVNFINCMLYVPELMNQPCKVYLNVPEDFQIACGLPFNSKTLKADSFFHLVDSPMIAGINLSHLEYQIESYSFHIWFQGDVNVPEEQLLSDFEKFTREQLTMMGGFPCSSYHFLFQITPDKSYHGVEHFNSTTITLGPDHQIFNSRLYKELLGVSSHELFHTWNIIRIKPKEFIPLSLDKEVVFNTGYVAEGFTTYYGDLFLVRSKVLTTSWYFSEIDKLLNRHFHNSGRFNLSLEQSSEDLWIDGYKKGIPDRKVSIYVKGALVALIIDLQIRKQTKNSASLDSVVNQLWEKYGDTRSGYDSEQIFNIIKIVSPTFPKLLFDQLVSETIPLESILDNSFEFIGCELVKGRPEETYQEIFGFKAIKQNSRFIIAQIFPGSAAVNKLSLDDEIISIDHKEILSDLNVAIGDKKSITLHVFRFHKLIEVKLEFNGQPGFSAYGIRKLDQVSSEQKSNFDLWLKTSSE